MAGSPAAAGTDGCAANGCAGVGGSAEPEPARCDAGPALLTRKRLDMLLVIDDAASMYPWWTSLVTGLDEFWHDAGSIGIGVGLQHFSGQTCGPQPYLVPLVPIAPLPDNTASLQQNVPPIPSATTSTIPALTGAQQSVRDWATAHNDAKVVLVLLTDASPGECDSLQGDYDQEAARVARAGYEGTPAVSTYVVGFGALQTLSTIARAGGTEPALVGVSLLDADAASALRTVRDDARPCAFRWSNGTTLAADAAVVVTDSSGSERRYSVQRDAATCDGQDGFYLEDETAPFPLIACPQTCASLSAAAQLTLSTSCKAP